MLSVQMVAWIASEVQPFNKLSLRELEAVTSILIIKMISTIMIQREKILVIKSNKLKAFNSLFREELEAQALQNNYWFMRSFNKSWMKISVPRTKEWIAASWILTVRLIKRSIRFSTIIRELVQLRHKLHKLTSLLEPRWMLLRMIGIMIASKKRMYQVVDQSCLLSFNLKNISSLLRLWLCISMEITKSSSKKIPKITQLMK